MPLRYKSGDEIRPGDVVELHGKPGKIEFVIEGKQDDPAKNWYFAEFGRGIMISESPEFGSLFIAADEIHENGYDLDALRFISRS